MARKAKPFKDYIKVVNAEHYSQEKYMLHPTTAFLSYLVDAKDAFIMCANSFKTSNNKYTEPAKQNLSTISTALLPAIMGHFEMWQKYMFSGIFELTQYYYEFNSKNFVKKLFETEKIPIDYLTLTAYNGLQLPVGLIFCDSLSGWHDPSKVNKHFHALFKDGSDIKQVFSNKVIKELDLLWQLRHSIVHTASTITFPDSYKVDVLKELRGKNIGFDHQFIPELVRKLHPLLQVSTEILKSNTLIMIDTQIDDRVNNRIDELFQIDSSVQSWLKQ